MAAAAKTPEVAPKLRAASLAQKVLANAPLALFAAGIASAAVKPAFGMADATWILALGVTVPCFLLASFQHGKHQPALAICRKGPRQRANRTKV
ncbi:hypothetical protein NB311A_21370 [Nitrobacter sp. Nb-311A]|nr:hypothetical protein NB311A_21370 [Nitrobacter sp. Nb-311A]